MPGHSASSRPSGNSGSHVGGNMGHSGSTASHGNFNGGGHSASIGGNHGGSYGHTAPGRTVSLRGGGSASIRPNGQIRSVNRNGMQIHNNLRGGRTIVSEHNGVRVVGTGRSNG
ncbi:MAG: hypothetical protein DMG79_04510, partial [Acidobacteria bacterium]